MALTQPQIAQLWIQQGGDPKYAGVMSRIAIRESGGRPGINNRGLNKNGTTDWGLFQVNDIWRRDPVVGPLFKSGKILTPAGATQAAIHILKVQGPKAWATYNPAVDAKYIGQMGSSGPVIGPKAPKTQAAPQAQGPDMRAQRASLIAQFVQQGGADNQNAVVGLAAGLNAVKAAESSAAAPAQQGQAPQITPAHVVGGSHGYVNPHPKGLVAPGRVDEGTDPTIAAGAPIVAVGRARIVNLSHNFYGTTPYLVYQLLDGPRKGQYVYESEYINPKVRPGQVVNAGQVVATGTGRAIEEGFAGGPRGSYLPLANRAQGGNYTEGAVTGPGLDWARFSRGLGARTGR